jgi:hypothetical protein
MPTTSERRAISRFTRSRRLVERIFDQCSRGNVVGQQILLGFSEEARDPRRDGLELFHHIGAGLGAALGIEGGVRLIAPRTRGDSGGGRGPACRAQIDRNRCDGAPTTWAITV